MHEFSGIWSEPRGARVLHKARNVSQTSGFTSKHYRPRGQRAQDRLRRYLQNMGFIEITKQTMNIHGPVLKCNLLTYYCQLVTTIIYYLAENCNPYCLLDIYHPLKRHSSYSPKSSPKTSPRSSPKLKKNSSSTLPVIHTTDTEEVLRTNTAKHTSEPQWNEEFEL